MASAMALEVCELLRLNRRDFRRMFSTTSTFYKRLEKTARERHERMLIMNSSQKTLFSQNAALRMAPEDANNQEGEEGYIMESDNETEDNNEIN